MSCKCRYQCNLQFWFTSGTIDIHLTLVTSYILFVVLESKKQPKTPTNFLGSFFFTGLKYSLAYVWRCSLAYVCELDFKPSSLPHPLISWVFLVCLCVFLPDLSVQGLLLATLLKFSPGRLRIIWTARNQTPASNIRGNFPTYCTLTTSCHFLAFCPQPRL